MALNGMQLPDHVFRLFALWDMLRKETPDCLLFVDHISFEDNKNLFVFIQKEPTLNEYIIRTEQTAD